MATTDLSIVNGALIMVGADDINSFDDASVEAKLAKSIYADTKFMLLQYNPWRFSLKQTDLGGALVETPLFKWDYKHSLPSNLLRIISIENEEDYEIFEDGLYSNQQNCKIIYQFKVLEADMPSYFIRALQFHLAKTFAISLQEDATKLKAFEAMADKETARARQIDAQQQPNGKIPDKNFSLLNIRG